MFPLGQAHMEPEPDIPRAEELFGLGQTDHVSLFGSLGQAWEVLPRIGGYLRDILRAAQFGQVHGQAVIEAGASIRGPVWIGDQTEIGCNAVLNPGAIIGRDCLLYQNVTFTGVLPARRLVKNKTELTVVEKREATG